MINLVLWLAGFIALALAIWKISGPLARLRELDRLAENAKRYDSWRGGSARTAADGETTGADVMRQLLRRQVVIWAAVGLVGVVLVVAGFAIR